MEGRKYDYKTDWERYAYPEEENRFLSLDEEELLKICDCVDTREKKPGRFGGGIPVHYQDGKLYTLRTGPHTRVEGQTGSKKSRTICRGAVISSALNGDSVIVTDPKGEICHDAKILYLLKKTGHKTRILDFRNLNADAYNCLTYAFEQMEKGRVNKAMSAIDRFVAMLARAKEGADDPFWNTNAGDLIRFSAQMLLIALSQLEDGEKAFNLISLKSFIRQDKDSVKEIADSVAENLPANMIFDPVRSYREILGNPDKTYACIVASANALLSEFASTEELLRMLSARTFDVRDFYKTPTALFLVLPDETSTYDLVSGYLIDTFYQILVETYGDLYTNKNGPPRGIHFICDEIAALKINDMASKISAARSRNIEFTLIYQSEKQMRDAYRKDWNTICGNCVNRIFLGSTDYDILKGVSDQIGTTNITPGGIPAPLVSVDALRHMRKEKTYKDALLMTGNYLVSLRLPDYDVYPFLKNECEEEPPSQRLGAWDIDVYTPENLYEDFSAGKIDFVNINRCRGKKEGLE